jgi:hypothetical protein
MVRTASNTTPFKPKTFLTTTTAIIDGDDTKAIIVTPFGGRDDFHVFEGTEVPKIQVATDQGL